MPIVQKARGKQTVSSVVQKYSAKVDTALKPLFEKASVTYPPQKIAFLAIKDQKSLELWAQDETSTWRSIKQYPVLKASGSLGPKLREGDEQVPEGIYQLEYLNPNSSYHLSMKINYPNAFDMIWAEKEGRTEPGTNIFIHGNELSIGCLAMGDKAIEELFVIVERVGLTNVTVIISPSDPRKEDLSLIDFKKPWILDLYKQITKEFLKITGK